MKPHRTFTITREFLKKHDACEAGIARVAKLLPAKLSTDPEKNYKLAFALADSAPALEQGVDDAYFLVGLCTSECNKLPDDDLLIGTFYHTERDAWITAQYLAWIADVLLSRDGR